MSTPLVWQPRRQEPAATRADQFRARAASSKLSDFRLAAAPVRLELVPHDQTRLSARLERRPPLGCEHSGIQITRFGATFGVRLGDQVADQNQAGRRAVINSSSHHWQSRLRPSRHAAKPVYLCSAALGVSARSCRRQGLWGQVAVGRPARPSRFRGNVVCMFPQSASAETLTIRSCRDEICRITECL